MPLAFYFYYRASEKITSTTLPLYSGGDVSSNLETEGVNSGGAFLSLAIFTTFGLFYTHHLTGFIFLFIFSFLIPFFLIINFRDFKKIVISVSRLVFSRSVLVTLALGLIFFFLVFTPNYMKTSAVETAVGAPSKSTREGLTLVNIKDSVGEARLALGIAGLFALAFFYKRKNFGYAIIFAWTVMIFLMSTEPQILFVNLPSSRIGNYLSYPLAILSAFSVVAIFSTGPRRFVPEKFLKISLVLILSFVAINGLKDSADAFKKSPDFSPTLQTFNASEYLVKNSTPDEKLLKDHNYLSGDTWMKLYFMRGYTYPLSRSFFKRYEDPTKPREMCTLNMISVPDGEEARNCFSETGVKYIMVNPRYDSSQFARLKNFDKIYDAGGVAIYYRK